MTSIMLEVKIDRADPVALHEQVAAQIRRSSPKETPNQASVFRRRRTSRLFFRSTRTRCRGALRELREEGLLEFRRGNVSRVGNAGAQPARYEGSRAVGARASR